MCIAESCERIDMDREEWKEVREAIQATGLNYQSDETGIWVQLPQVTTKGERDLHLDRLKPIVNKLKSMRIAKVNAWKKEAKKNLKKFA